MWKFTSITTQTFRSVSSVCNAVCCNNICASTDIGNRHCHIDISIKKGNKEPYCKYGCSFAGLWIRALAASEFVLSSCPLWQTDVFLLKQIPHPPVVEHKQVMLQPPYCMGWEEIKTFQVRGITLNVIQELCGRIQKLTKFPSSQIDTLYIVLSHCCSITMAFLPACEISDFFLSL